MQRSTKPEQRKEQGNPFFINIYYYDNTIAVTSSLEQGYLMFKQPECNQNGATQSRDIFGGDPVKKNTLHLLVPLVGLRSSDYLWHNLRPSSHLFSPELVTMA